MSSMAQISSSKEQQEIHGPVLSVTIERARISNEDKTTELNRKKVDVVSYDDMRRPNKRDVYDDYGFIVGGELYQYSPTGLLSYAIFSDVKGRNIERRVYEYDSTGKLISIKTYDGRMRLKLRQDYQHDVKSRRIIEVLRGPDKVVGKTIWRLDENGTTTEVVYFEASGQVEEKRLYKYDGEGNLAEETRLNADGLVKKRFSHCYQLDPHRNWVVRRTTVSLETVDETYQSIVVTYRTIKYDEPNRAHPGRWRL
jgi:hypothetical protein